MEKSNDPGKISPDLIRMVENAVSNMRLPNSRLSPPQPPPAPNSSPSVPSTSEPMDLNKIISMATQILQSEEGASLKNLMSSAMQSSKPVYCEEKGCPEEKKDVSPRNDPSKEDSSSKKSSWKKPAPVEDSSPKKSSGGESLTDIIGSLNPLFKSVMDQVNADKKKSEEESKVVSSSLTSCFMDCCRMGMETNNKKLQAFCFIEKISLFSKMYLTAMTVDQTLPSESINVLRSELNSQFANALKQLDPCASPLPQPD